MSWQGRKVLVTGGGGFIGSHLVEALVQAGAEVRAFVRYVSHGGVGSLSHMPPDIMRAVHIVRGDIRDADAVRRAMERMDTVFHLSALIAIPYSYVHPREVIETNVVGAVNVLEAARSVGVRRVINTSTSEVYGTARYTPIDETHPMQGQSPYSASKIGADRIAESYFRSFNVPVVTLRPFNTYGPRQSGRAVIPTIIAQALSGGPVRLGSLAPVRDFTFVRDTVAGFLKVGVAEGVVGEEINLGSGTAVTMGELADMIFDILGKKIEIVLDRARVRPEKSEVMKLVANNKKASDLLGWSPTVDLKTGLRETIEWMRVHMELYNPAEYGV
jgi:dTDP-glucose 4,6-dehydratase